jgi:hypothetical protein
VNRRNGIEPRYTISVSGIYQCSLSLSTLAESQAPKFLCSAEKFLCSAKKFLCLARNIRLFHE